MKMKRLFRILIGLFTVFNLAGCGKIGQLTVVDLNADNNTDTDTDEDPIVLTCTATSTVAWDTSFATVGYRRIHLDGVHNASRYGDGPLAVSSTGEVYVGGNNNNGSYNDAIVVKLDEEGELVSDFGVSGVLSFDLSVVSSSKAIYLDGTDLIIGYTKTGGRGAVKINTDGDLDNAFGTSGVALHTYTGSGDNMNISPLDGSIVSVGHNNDAGHDLSLSMFNAYGSLNTGIGVGGMIDTALSGDEFGWAFGWDGNNGDFFLAGQRYIGGATNFDFSITRFNADGTIDTSYGTSGTTNQSFSAGRDYINDIHVESDGTIYAVGCSQVGGVGDSFCDMIVAKFLPTGALDTSFGSSGSLSIDYSAGNWDEYNKVLKVSDDVFLLLGLTRLAGDAHIIITAIDSDGNLITSFGTSGHYTYNVGTGLEEMIVNARLDYQNRLIIYGYVLDSFREILTGRVCLGTGSF
jgi:uncharacterized delta-60 repeat protein